MSAPDLTKKVVGYRYWIESEGALNSQGHTTWTWGRGVQEARCDKHSGMYPFGSLGRMAEVSAPCAEAPGHGCTCGLHAYHEPPEVAKRGPFQNPGTHVLGVVLAWGRMEVHRNGFRAQFSEILCLGYNPLWPQSVIDKTKELARGYEVDCIPLDQLKAFAEAHGVAVPEDLRPEASQIEPSGIFMSSHMAQQYQHMLLSPSAFSGTMNVSVSAGSLMPLPKKRPSVFAEAARFMGVWLVIYLPLATAALALGAGPWTPTVTVPTLLIFLKLPSRVKRWITSEDPPPEDES